MKISKTSWVLLTRALEVGSPRPFVTVCIDVCKKNIQHKIAILLASVYILAALIPSAVAMVV